MRARPPAGRRFPSVRAAMRRRSVRIRRLLVPLTLVRHSPTMVVGSARRPGRYSARLMSRGTAPFDGPGSTGEVPRVSGDRTWTRLQRLMKTFCIFRTSRPSRVRQGASGALSSGSASRPSRLCSCGSRRWRSMRGYRNPVGRCVATSFDSSVLRAEPIPGSPRSIPGSSARRSRWHEALELAGRDPASAWLSIALRTLSSG